MSASGRTDFIVTPRRQRDQPRAAVGGQAHAPEGKYHALAPPCPTGHGHIQGWPLLAFRRNLQASGRSGQSTTAHPQPHPLRPPPPHMNKILMDQSMKQTEQNAQTQTHRHTDTRHYMFHTHMQYISLAAKARSEAKRGFLHKLLRRFMACACWRGLHPKLRISTPQTINPFPARLVLSTTSYRMPRQSLGRL